MGVRIIKARFDDLDKTEYDEGEGQTVEFSLDGTAYTIDLTNANAAAFRETLRPYIDAGQRVTAQRKSGRTKAADGLSIPERRAQTQRIREYGRSQGMEISDRGPLPAGLREKYFAAGLT